MARLSTHRMRRLWNRLVGSAPEATPFRPTVQEGLVDISDPFITWLCFANAGMLHRGNLYCFDLAMRSLPSNAPMVEIGSFAGLSTNAIAYYRRVHGRTNPLITTDKWLFEGAPSGHKVGNSELTHDELRLFIMETFRRNVTFFGQGQLPHAMEMLSGEFFDAWRRKAPATDLFGRSVSLGGPISFCYVDGDHTYEGARRDFEGVDEFLEPGGFLFFDDSADGSGWEVSRVVKEVAGTGRYELVARNPNYLFRRL